MMLQNHFHIIQTFCGRGAEDNIIGFGDIFFDLLIAEHFAAKFVSITLQAGFVDVKRRDDFPAELDDCAAVRLGNIAGADH